MTVLILLSWFLSEKAPPHTAVAWKTAQKEMWAKAMAVMLILFGAMFSPWNPTLH